MKNQVRSVLEAFGINLARDAQSLGLTDFDEVKNLLLSLRPKNNGHKLIRVGAQGDGGYLVPDDFVGVTHLLSPGCDLLWAFEEELHSRFGIEFFICDESSKKPQDLPDSGHFTEGFVGPATQYPDYISLSDWIKKEKVSGREKIMQIDIEGAEFLSLLSLSRSELEEFRIIVIELHFLEALKNAWAFKQLYKPFFEKLLNSFDVIHVHPNNCCGTWKYRKISFPRLIEVTLHRKDRRLSNPSEASTPNILDQDCVSENPTMFIDWNLLQVIGR